MTNLATNVSAKGRLGYRFVTESHRTAAITLLTTGDIFFSDERTLTPGLKLRLFPLIVGPTGAGKSSLVKSIAHLQHARYLKVTRSDWIVQGSTRGRPTMYQILDYITTHKRVIVHIDELDKFQISFGSQEWSASIAGDLWSLLDGAFPVSEYLRDTPFAEPEKPSEHEINSWIQSRCLIIGSGTWQDVFQANRAGSAIGFLGNKTETPVTADTIAHAKLISPELLHRFNSDVIFLKYPDLKETSALLESTGINALAREMGQTISPKEINFEQGGMRVLESIATRLVIARHIRRTETRKSPPVVEQPINIDHPTQTDEIQF